MCPCAFGRSSVRCSSRVDPSVHRVSVVAWRVVHMVCMWESCNVVAERVDLCATSIYCIADCLLRCVKQVFSRCCVLRSAVCSPAHKMCVATMSKDPV